jgi:hypothetical protein
VAGVPAAQGHDELSADEADLAVEADADAEGESDAAPP